MQINIEVENIVSNVKEAENICLDSGITVAVMVKDFYSKLRIQDRIENKIWSSKGVKNSYNYILFKNNIWRHKGGLVTTIDEVQKLSKSCKRYKRKFQGFVPINMFDDREGLSMFNAIRLIRFAKYYENKYFTLKAVSFTNGCLKDDLFSVDTLLKSILKLRLIGVNYVSVGGSYYLGKLLNDKLKKAIDEVRIGEFVLYGTIPFHDKKDYKIGLNALDVDMEIIAIYEDRKQALLKGGSSDLDTDLSELVSKGFEFVSVSTEYTIVKYENKPLLGDTVKFIPNYHSMIKLLR